MAIDTTSPRTRRAILLGALGGAVASVVAAIGRASPASAADGEVMHVGGKYGSSHYTSVTNIVTSETAFLAQSQRTSGNPQSGRGFGLAGGSDLNTGVYGTSSATDQPAILGQSYANSTGVQGFSGGGLDDPPAALAKTGVFGSASQGDGIVGMSDAAGKSGLYANNSSAGGWGVNGSNDGALTNGYIGGRNGAFGQARGTAGSGVVGYSGTASPMTGPAHVGVYGVADHGRGGVFKGTTAQVRLVPGSASTHPLSGVVGDLFLDSAGDLWLCKGSATWVQLG